jgi:hypothetical protein
MCADKEDVAKHFDPRTHNGYVTIENPSTGNHRTFKIWTEKWGDEENRVVALLTGPDRDNPKNWTKFAFVGEGGIYVWSRYRSDTGDKTQYQKMADLLSRPEAGREAGLNYLFEGRCRRCNRSLTVPESIRKGIGPICEGKET